MSNHFKKQPPPPKASELRRNQRCRLSTPPEAEIFHSENPALITVRLGDLSSGGCFVETSYSVPVETEVTLILTKSGDQVRAQARVVRVFPNKGLGLEFLSIEGNGFQVLQDWLSTSSPQLGSPPVAEKANALLWKLQLECQDTMPRERSSPKKLTRLKLTLPVAR